MSQLQSHAKILSTQNEDGLWTTTTNDGGPVFHGLRPWIAGDVHRTSSSPSNSLPGKAAIENITVWTAPRRFQMAQPRSTRDGWLRRRSSRILIYPRGTCRAKYRTDAATPRAATRERCSSRFTKAAYRWITAAAGVIFGGKCLLKFGNALRRRSPYRLLSCSRRRAAGGARWPLPAERPQDAQSARAVECW